MDPNTVPIIVGFVLALKFFMGAGAAILSYKIARMSVTPSGIWFLYMAAYIALTIRAIERVLYIHVYTDTAQVYGFGPVFMDLFLAGFIYVALFAATLKVFLDLKAKFKGLL
jgi:hypothetical protein